MIRIIGNQVRDLNELVTVYGWQSRPYLKEADPKPLEETPGRRPEPIPASQETCLPAKQAVCSSRRQLATRHWRA